MTTKSFISVISVVALVGVILTSALRTPAEQASDKNGPGVVRVSVVEGSAVVQRGDSHVQTNAVRNAPMLPGDYISTGKTSRAELQFDGYTAVRLGGNVQARIVNNDPKNRKVQIADGTTEIGMVRDGQTMQIDTPSVTVRARQAGDFRISINSDGSSWITARRGSVEVASPQRTYTLETGRTLVARGSASNPSITYVSEVAFDSFDDFNVQRDKTMVTALNASPNLNPSIAGYDNLDAYGQWQAVAGYGQSWVPNEPAGWVPYRNGSWVWEGGYGWTWVGSEPWGWAPYHYGNWYYCGCGPSGWAWLPPAYAATPAFSPALVGFFGADVAAGVGYNPCGGNYGNAPGSYGAPAAPYGNAVPAAPAAPYGNAAPAAPYSSGAPAPYGVGGPGGYGNPATPYGYGSGYPPSYGYPYPYIGWVPIAPFQPFYPWWPGWLWAGFGWTWPTVAFGYPGFFGGNVVNVTNITNITNNRNFRHGGATGTTIGNFRHGTINGRTVAVTSRNLRRAGMFHGAVPVTPTRSNLGFRHGTVHAPVTFSRAFNSPRFAMNRTLVARTSFAAQQRTVAQAFAHGTVAARAPAHAPVTHANSLVSGRANAPITHANAPVNRVSAPVNRVNAPVNRVNAPISRANAPVNRVNGPVNRVNAPVNHANAPVNRVNAPVSRANAPVNRVNGPVNHVNAPITRGNAVAPRTNAVTANRSEFAPTTSWQRFNEARGTGVRGSGLTTGSERSMPTTGTSGRATSNMGSVRAPESIQAPRQAQAPSDSWGRFSTGRGNVAAPVSSERGSFGSAPSYSRGSYGSPYTRESAPSYARPSYGSPYSRGSFGSAPSYSRGSYGSPYSRGSFGPNPSYSRGSYGSPYSRGSYPSYSRGSFGSAPSYSRGSAPSYSRPAPVSAPARPSGGGGGGARYSGGGRPPH
ncbi:MAG TPA: DUF6600 domain-containing protein [Candidatus Cybelea sp.]|jgi:hypothetical protein|nr:DUF6600 domain-containing protein [Candidatus Cybelea sp.]